MLLKRSGRSNELPSRIETVRTLRHQLLRFGFLGFSFPESESKSRPYFLAWDGRDYSKPHKVGPGSAGIPYTLLLRIEAMGFPTFRHLLYA